MQKILTVWVQTKPDKRHVPVGEFIKAQKIPCFFLYPRPPKVAAQGSPAIQENTLSKNFNQKI